MDTDVTLKGSRDPGFKKQAFHWSGKNEAKPLTVKGAQVTTAAWLEAGKLETNLVKSPT